MLHHAQDHLEIIQAINKQKNISLIFYQIDPYNPNDRQGWELRHQQMHDDFNSALDLSSSDLSSIDDQDDSEREEYAALHFREHQNARLTLGI